MLHEMTLFEVLEIHELLAFKTNSLVKSKLFLKIVKDENHTILLETDIDQSTREISNLQQMLFRTAK